jgi:hypothetical protein
MHVILKHNIQCTPRAPLHKKIDEFMLPLEERELLQHSAPLVIQHKNLESYLVIIFS